AGTRARSRNPRTSRTSVGAYHLAAPARLVAVLENQRRVDERLALRPALEDLVELAQLGLGEAGLDPLLARDLARAEREARVGLALEVGRAARVLRIVARELLHPVAAEPHVRELVGEHEVDRLLDHAVSDRAAVLDQRPERVAREALEAAVHAGH